MVQGKKYHLYIDTAAHLRLLNFILNGYVSVEWDFQ